VKARTIRAECLCCVFEVSIFFQPKSRPDVTATIGSIVQTLTQEAIARGGGMTATEGRNDWLTAAALGLLAMCAVTFDHEALGHGGACLLLHGRIVLVTSSLFRCDVKSDWIDPAGPGTNLLMGALALAWLRLIRPRRAALRLFLILVTAMSFFWEENYVVDAMHHRDGDLYFFARFLLGEVPLWLRWAAAAGLALYVATIWMTAAGLSALWPEARVARAMARTAWLSATVGGGGRRPRLPGPGLEGSPRRRLRDRRRVPALAVHPPARFEDGRGRIAGAHDAQPHRHWRGGRHLCAIRRHPGPWRGVLTQRDRVRHFSPR
jgi:hypothetical protein